MYCHLLLLQNLTHSKKKRKRKNRSPTDSSNSTTSSSNSLKQKPKSLIKEEVITSFTGDPVVYPPCVRLMVLASQYAQTGQLFIITSQESTEGKGCIGKSSHLCPYAHLTNDPEISERTSHSSSSYTWSCLRCHCDETIAFDGNYPMSQCIYVCMGRS
ncbi:unnamed protein product [Schistosoma bovis]|nr:unnamed protein product [Schistosoma bovis]